MKAGVKPEFPNEGTPQSGVVSPLLANISLNRIEEIHNSVRYADDMVFFLKLSYSENKHVMVKGEKSPFNGDLSYWSERNSKLYDGTTAKILKRQHHSCGHCGLKFMDSERVHLHHIDGNHENWMPKNLTAIHKSCHDLIHMGKRSKEILNS